MPIRSLLAILVTALVMGLGAAQGPAYRPPAHTQATPILNLPPEMAEAYAAGGAEIERDRSPADLLDDHRRIGRVLAALGPQRKGQVDAYVVAIALDSDPVFGREAREAGKVLARRYNATGRVVVLAGSDGSAPSALPRGSLSNLALTLARIAELMDRREDVLILYSTSHGAPIGVVYNDGDQGFGVMAPKRLAAMLDGLGIKRRVVVISACYAGGFAPALASEDSAVLTASAADRTSFGCQSDNDWTFYGDALINHALRKAQPLDVAAADAATMVAAWEVENQLPSSDPKFSLGNNVRSWLSPLEAKIPAMPTPPVGRPATALFGRQ